MNTDLSPESEAFIQTSIAAGVFQDRGHALDEAVALLRRRQELIAHLEEGTQQLQSGDFTEYDDDGLRRFFDEVQTEGRARYEASREHP